MSIAASRTGASFWKPRITARFYFSVVSAAWMALMSLELARHGSEVAGHLVGLLPWVVAYLVVSLLPVTLSGHTTFTPDFPILVAGALALTPIEIGLVVFTGGFDVKELRRQVSPAKAMFNRSQVSLCCFAASWLAHSLSDRPDSSPSVLGMAILVLVAFSIINGVLVATAVSLCHGVGFSDSFKSMYVGSGTDYVLTSLSWAVLGAMLAAFYQQVKPFELLVFLVPALLGRQALLRSQMFIESTQAYRAREEALKQLTARIYEERCDERRLIAADLHDEVLQPLYKVTLMAHVIKADLATGQLLALEADLPELLTATEAASATLRDLIGDLRKSTLGRGGLALALANLIASYSSRRRETIHQEIQPVSASPQTELGLYQIAKEALSNALTHAQAANIWVILRQVDEEIELTVQDDGIGFDPLLDRSEHYGIAIMRERASTIGARLFLDSSPGRGSTLRVLAPSDD